MSTRRMTKCPNCRMKVPSDARKAHLHYFHNLIYIHTVQGNFNLCNICESIFSLLTSPLGNEISGMRPGLRGEITCHGPSCSMKFFDSRKWEQHVNRIHGNPNDDNHSDVVYPSTPPEEYPNHHLQPLKFLLPLHLISEALSKTTWNPGNGLNPPMT